MLNSNPWAGSTAEVLQQGDRYPFPHPSLYIPYPHLLAQQSKLLDRLRFGMSTIQKPCRPISARKQKPTADEKHLSARKVEIMIC